MTEAEENYLKKYFKDLDERLANQPVNEPISYEVLDCTITTGSCRCEACTTVRTPTIGATRWE